MKRFRRALGAGVVSWLGPFLVRRLASTWKVRTEGLEHFDAATAGQRGLLVAFWHGRILPAMAEHQDRGFWVLLSRSEDGDLIGEIMRRFGYRVVRGSTHRGGASSLRPMLAALADGGVIGVTPDGPRGPRHSMTHSLSWMARASGAAILPFGLGVNRAWRANSWDRFTVPKVGAKIGIVWGAPIYVPADADEARIEQATEEVRMGLLAAERRAFELAGGTPDW